MKLTYDLDKNESLLQVQDQEADGISFFADGTVNMDVVKYDLVNIEG